MWSSIWTKIISRCGFQMSSTIFRPPARHSACQIDAHERDSLLEGRWQLDHFKPPPKLADETGLSERGRHREPHLEDGISGRLFAGERNRPNGLVLCTTWAFFCFHEHERQLHARAV